MAEDNDDVLGDICLDDIPEKPQRILPDPVFPIKPDFLSAEDLEQLLQDLQDNPELIEPPTLPSDDSNNAQEIEEATPDDRTPCVGGVCPPGQMCVDGFCVPDPDSQIPGSLTKADLEERGNIPDATGTANTLDADSERLRAARELFNKTRFIPEFPDGAQFRHFTSANKNIDLFLPQSNILFRSTAAPVQALKTKLNKIKSYIAVVNAAKNTTGDININDILSNKGGYNVAVNILTQNYGRSAFEDGTGSSGRTMLLSVFQAFGNNIAERHRLKKENLLTRTYLPTSFINDHSDMFAEFFSSMEQVDFETRYGQDLNLNGTVKTDPAFVERPAGHVLFSLPTGDLVRLFLSVIYQQSKKFIESLPDLYGDNSSEIIDSLVSTVVGDGGLSSDQIEKYGNILLDDRDLSWTLNLEEDMNPAAYNIMLPSDYKSSLFYQYLTKTSPRAKSIPNVVGKAQKGFDPLRQVMGLHYTSIEEQERENSLTGRNSQGSQTSLNISDNFFGEYKSEVAKGNRGGIYYPGASRMGNSQPIKIEKIKLGHPDYRVAIDPNVLNPSQEELGTYSGALFPAKTGYNQYVISRAGTRWKYENDLLLNSNFKVNEDSVIKTALTTTREYFKISYHKDRHDFYAGPNPGAYQLDNGRAERKTIYKNDGMFGGLSIIRDLGLHQELGDDGVLFSVNLPKLANSINLGTEHQEDIRNYLALGFNFRNWLYGFGVHPYFGGYKNIREEAQKKLVIEKSYNTDEFYSKFMPLGRLEHKAGERFTLQAGLGNTVSVPKFCSYTTWQNHNGGESFGLYYNPTPCLEEISQKAWMVSKGSLPDNIEENGDALLADGLYDEWGKFYATKTDQVVDNPYSTNLFPVIPFFSNGNPIEYLEGDHPYDNIPAACLYGFENYVENDDYTQYKDLNQALRSFTALPPWPEWSENRLETLSSVDQALPPNDIAFNNIGSIVTGPGNNPVSYIRGEGGNFIYRIAPNLNSVPTPTNNPRLISFGAITDLSIGNRQFYDKDKLNRDYMKYSYFMNNPLINPNLSPPTAGRDAIFQDFYTQVPLFLNKKELKDKFQIKTNDHFDIEPVYNFYNSSYEELVANAKTSRIPTPYLLNNLNKGEVATGDFSRLENMIGETSTETVYNQLLPIALTNENLSFHVNDKDFKRIFEERYKNPMYVQMEFSSKQKSATGFAEAISKSIIKTGDRNTYYDNLISTLINDGGDMSGTSYEPSVILSELSQYGNIQNDANNTLQNPRILNYSAAREEISKSDFQNALERHRERITSKLTGRIDGVDISAVKTIPFDQWLDTLDVPGGDELNNDEDLSLDDVLIKLVNKERLIQRVKKIIDDKKRTMEEVFNGVPAYSETLVHKVVKYEVDPESLEFIEGTKTSFYFSNIEDEDIVRFFDSQVQYGKLYRYEVYRVIVTIGTKYAYFDNNTQSTINDLSLKTSPAAYLTREEAFRLCFLNPLLASQLSIITLKTAMKISHSRASLNPQGFANSEERLATERYSRALSSRYAQAANGISDAERDAGNQILEDAGAFDETIKSFEDARRLIIHDMLFFYHDLRRQAPTDAQIEETATGLKDLMSRLGKTIAEANTAAEKYRSYAQVVKGTPSMYFGVVSRPDVKIIEVLDRSRNIAILDKPPVPPEADIHPVINNQRNILLSFRTGLGEFYDEPIPLEDDDYEQFKIAAYAQGIDGAVFDSVSDDQTSGPMLHFKSDDKAKFFEIFRIEEPPESWEDFYNFKIAKIETDNGLAQMYDSVVPNKEYYYTFRSEDIHGHVSNPSQIYKIINRVVDQGSNLEKELYRFDSGKNLLDQKRSFDRFIEIKPSIENRRINIEFIEEEPDRGEVYGSLVSHFGSGTNIDHKPWNKKFKIRLTSKTTGRQIEVNINYQLIYNKDGLPETTKIVADYIGDQHFSMTRENIQHKVKDILKKSGLLKE